ncbi:MAG: hypothetical protein ABWK53_08920 [Anaerolineales bacterium]
MNLLRNLSPRGWLWLTLGVAIFVRILLFLTYPVGHFSDTNAYRGIAETVLSADWPAYNYIRTPGYPLFLALLGPDRVVYAAQLSLGVATTLLLFYLGWKISGQPWFGALAGLAHSLNLGQLFFEANILSESLTTFLVALLLGGVAWLLDAPPQRPAWRLLLMGFLLGLTGGLLTLTRPQFIFLPFWAAFLLVALWHGRSAALRWGAALLLALTSLAFVGGWMLKLHQRFGIWGMDIMSGYHLVQHTGAWFEYVPDEYAAVRDTYIEYREMRRRETGQPNNAIWDAIPAIQEASGLGFIELSQLMARLSIRLILEHPLRYLVSAAQGWWWFWKAPFYWTPEAIAHPALRAVVRALVLLERGALFAANMTFLAGSLALLWKKVRRRLAPGLLVWFAFGTVWFTSILQTLLDHGDNPRFSVSIQSLVVLLVGWGIVQFIGSKKKIHETAAA